MTWEDYMEVVDWMTVRWGEMARWGEEKVYAMYDDLKAWPSVGALRAVRSHYEEGNARAPHGGQIIKTMRSLGFTPELDELGDHRHTWAFDETIAGTREAVCVVCSTTSTFTDKQLRTPGEWETFREEQKQSTF